MQAILGILYIFLFIFYSSIILSKTDTKETKLQRIIKKLEKEDEIDSAITILELVITYKNNPEYVLQIARLLKKKKRYTEAISHLEKARTKNPEDNDLLIALIETHRAEQRYDVIADLLAQLNPTTKLEAIKKQYEQAALYNGKKKYEQAIPVYEELLKDLPKNKTILLHYAHTLRCLERIPEAIYYFQKVLELDPDYHIALFSKALAELTAGNYHDGFSGYELRRHYLKTVSETIYTTQELWDGKKSLVGKKILIYAEQGLGDTIQYIRFLECLKKEGAYIIFAVQDRLFTLIQHCYSFYDELIPLKDAAPEHDYYAPLMSLPHLFYISIGTIPSSSTPYIFPDQTLGEKWKSILDQDHHFKIGICHKTSNVNLNLFSGPITSNRSIDLELLLDAFADIPDITFYLLEKDTDIQKNYQNLIIFDESFDTEHGSFMDSAAIIPQLDLVISVDTSVAHLAAALGAKTFILLPKPADWRWLYNRTDSPWYKDVTLLRQQESDNWKTVIHDLKQAILQLMQEKIY